MVVFAAIQYKILAAYAIFKEPKRQSSEYWILLFGW